MDTSEIVSSAEAAKLLGVHLATFLRMVGDGRMPERINPQMRKQWRWKRTAILEALRILEGK